MANDLMTARKNELAPTGLGDPFAEYADAIAPKFIIGDLLKFSKGDYYAGINSQMVPLGTTFTANLDELMAAWVRWWDGKPTDHVMVRVADHVAPKKRVELGDSDEAQWETDKGERRDPWQFTNYLPLMNEKGELFTFTTGSRGGISAVAGLARRYANHRRHHPDVFPLIALNVDSYQHPVKEYGRIKIPVFTPAGYQDKAKFIAALAAAGIVTEAPPIDHEAKEAAQARDALDDMLNDEIPY
jgi:hypothetical protein